MRVLLISTVDVEKNGITGVIFNYLKVLKNKGIVFDLVAKNDPSKIYTDDIEDTGGSVFVIKRNLKSLANYFFSLRRLIKNNDYDIVHIHGNSGTCIIEAVAAKLGGAKKIIAHAHASDCKFKLAHKLLKPFLNIMLDGRLACSDLAGRFLYGKREYVILKNAIDTQKYRYNEKSRNEIRNKYGISEDAFVIGHVGLFNYLKNHEFLIRVFEELHKNNDNSILMLIGEGENKEHIKAEVVSRGLDGAVIFVGTCNNVCEYMSAFDFFLLPSKHEALGFVLIEAQSSGLSCLASSSVSRMSNLSGNVEYFGLDEEPSAWVEKIKDMRNTKDRALKSEDAIIAISSLGYNINNEGRALVDYYKKVLDK